MAPCGLADNDCLWRVELQMRLSLSTLYISVIFKLNINIYFVIWKRATKINICSL